MENEVYEDNCYVACSLVNSENNLYIHAPGYKNV